MTINFEPGSDFQNKSQIIIRAFYELIDAYTLPSTWADKS